MYILILLNYGMSGYKFFIKEQVQPEESCANFPLTLSLVPSSISVSSKRSEGLGLITLLSLTLPY